MGIINRISSFFKRDNEIKEIENLVNMRSEAMLNDMVLALAKIQGIEPEAIIGAQKADDFNSYKSRYIAAQMKETAEMLLDITKKMEEFKKEKLNGNNN